MVFSSSVHIKCSSLGYFSRVLEKKNHLAENDYSQINNDGNYINKMDEPPR